MAPLQSSYPLFLFPFLFLFSISSLLVPAASSTKSAEVSALNNLYTSLNKASQLSGWKSSGGDPCDDSWKGITCSGSSITEIKLSGLGLSGSLGYQLTSLTSLTHFDLSKNNLNGDIPYQLPPNVVHVDLSGNSFTGAIAYSISQMSDLEYLNLAHNQLKGQITDMFGKLPRLSKLDLSFNQLSGNLPQSFKSLKSLKTLNLQNNQLTGSINVLANLPLEDLNVQNNQFTGPVPPKLKNIDNLQIGGSSLSGSSHSKDKSKDKNKGSKGKILIGIIVGVVVVAMLLVIVILLAVLRRRKPSSAASSVYHDEESCHDRSVTPIVDTELKENVADSCSINTKGPETTPTDLWQYPPDLRPSSPDLRPTTTGGRKSSEEKEFSIKLNSRHSVGHELAASYSFIDLEAATGSFNANRLLGRGSIGSVYKAKYADGKVLAVKKIDATLPRGSPEDFMGVIAKISQLHHPNIAELIGFCLESGYQLLVYEFHRNGSLHEFLHLSDDYSRPLTWDTRVRIALGIARAIEYLHEICSPSFVHKNIKSGNVLLDAELNPHLSECGLTAYYEGDNSSPGYNAPECTRKPSSHTVKSDVYSFGVIMLELLTGRMPFDSSKPKAEQCLVSWATPQLLTNGAQADIVDPALRGLYPPKSVSRFADVVTRCVQPEPESRPPISEVVQALAVCIRRPSFKTGPGGMPCSSMRSDDSDYGYY